MNMELPNYDIREEIINNISNEINNKLESFITEGLKLKGYEFENRYELESFIKRYCRCEDNVGLSERIYFVNDIPFMLHNYKIGCDFSVKDEGGKIMMNAIYGSFAYL
jgi:hypothetical protein